MTWERVFVRLQLLALALAALTGAVWGSREFVRAVTGAGTPTAGELVPRQIPYRGYLEVDGVAVNTPAQALRFSLRLLDGGTAWFEDLSVPVQNGQFSVELGDSLLNSIPRSALLDPGIELRVQVNPPSGPLLAGGQRLLSVPFARTAQFPPAVLAGIERRCGNTGTQLFDGTTWGPCNVPDQFCEVPTRPGCSASTAAQSCKTLRADPLFRGTDGVFWIDPDGAVGLSPFEAYCDMTTAGGGWTRALSVQAPGVQCTLIAAARGDPSSGGTCAKLADATINLLATERVFFTQIAGAERLYTRYSGSISTTSPSLGQLVNKESYWSVVSAPFVGSFSYQSAFLFHQYDHYDPNPLKGAKATSCLFSLEYISPSVGTYAKYAVCGSESRDQGMMFAYVR